MDAANALPRSIFAKPTRRQRRQAATTGGGWSSVSMGQQTGAKKTGPAGTSPGKPDSFRPSGGLPPPPRRSNWPVIVGGLLATLGGGYAIRRHENRPTMAPVVTKAPAAKSPVPIPPVVIPQRIETASLRISGSQKAEEMVEQAIKRLPEIIPPSIGSVRICKPPLGHRLKHLGIIIEMVHGEPDQTRMGLKLFIANTRKSIESQNLSLSQRKDLSNFFSAMNNFQNSIPMLINDSQNRVVEIFEKLYDAFPITSLYCDGMKSDEALTFNQLHRLQALFNDSETQEIGLVQAVQKAQQNLKDDTATPEDIDYARHRLKKLIAWQADARTLLNQGKRYLRSVPALLYLFENKKFSNMHLEATEDPNLTNDVYALLSTSDPHVLPTAVEKLEAVKEMREDYFLKRIGSNPSPVTVLFLGADHDLTDNFEKLKQDSFAIAVVRHRGLDRGIAELDRLRSQLHQLALKVR